MSGGKYDHICYRLEDIQLENIERDPRRAAFQQLLGLVTKALHDVEWVDSGDYSPGDENQAIDACFSFLKANPETLIKAAAYDSLKESLNNFFKLEGK